jgi:hypothetical protein
MDAVVGRMERQEFEALMWWNVNQAAGEHASAMYQQSPTTKFPT